MPPAEGVVAAERDWCVVIPVKDTRRGKSRIAVPPDVRRALAIAMVRDTLAAVLRVPMVDRVIAVCDTERDAALLDQDRVITHIDRWPRGLNAAVTTGATLARQLNPDCNLAALPGDLPALNSIQLSHTLAYARRHARSFVADGEGTGTTLLAARRGHMLNPCYGTGSRMLHAASGAVELTGGSLDSLRWDVDDLDSLGRIASPTEGRDSLRSTALALGPWTTRVLTACLQRGNNDPVATGGR